MEQELKRKEKTKKGSWKWDRTECITKTCSQVKRMKNLKNYQNTIKENLRVNRRKNRLEKIITPN